MLSLKSVGGFFLDGQQTKKAKKKKKEVLRRSLLSSWYPPARPDPAGLSRQQLLRNLCKERDRSETVCPQTPSRIRHPPSILPTAGMAPSPQPRGGLCSILQLGSEARRVAEGFIQPGLKKPQGWGPKTPMLQDTCGPGTAVLIEEETAATSL